MQASTMVRVGALCGGLAVGLGAFAAHGMKAHYDPTQLQTFETGVRYQMYHALALVSCGALAATGRRTSGAALAFLAGIALFSGSLYALVWTGVTGLGAVTPVGGVAFLVGWLLLAVRAMEPGAKPA